MSRDKLTTSAAAVIFAISLSSLAYAGEPRGACCLSGGTCEDRLTTQDCFSQGGAYLGDGTACSAEACEQTIRRVDASTKGSLLIFSKVELRWGPDGGLTQDTILEITNDFQDRVCVQLYFVNGDEQLDPIFTGSPPMQIAEGEPGWNKVNCSFCLTKDHPTYWSAATGLPHPHPNLSVQGAGCQPFHILDPAGDDGIPGRPDPNVPGGKMLRGFIYGWAVDGTGCQIRWNHLSGTATLINYADTTAWDYNAWAFQVNDPFEQGQRAGNCGAVAMNGVIYDSAYDLLLFDFFRPGSMALSSGTNMVATDTSLTLHPVSVDFRQDADGPFTTKAHFDIWNQNEIGMSGTHRCITCWDQTLLSQYNNPNNFIYLQTNKGKARISGLRSNLCDVNCIDHPMVGQLGLPKVCSVDAALIGVSAKMLAFSGSAAGRATSGRNLVGMGTKTAAIRYNLIAPPGELIDEAADAQHDIRMGGKAFLNDREPHDDSGRSVLPVAPSSE